ncbi:alkyl sulfatase dimerization domain-containing protein [uncultured Vibrio sp.]|uniref:alkyl/aryl-sulfatase n=1 Tax=uncultured Vibrio sp. TaxID=114054 RepID=UPI0025E5A7A3|nr:alkyl sulfatase dimerization domain-containing protein [uncultured Vibrio sp.]
MRNTTLSIAILSTLAFNATAQSHDHEHFDALEMARYKGKAATEHTIKANRDLANRLPFEDRTAFEEQSRGLIASFGDHDAGLARIPFINFMQNVNPEQYPDTVNPSIFRQGLMNYQAQGLYQVVEGVYQIRGSDVSNITVFRTDTGYVINDPGLLDETTQNAWEFAKLHLPAPHTIHAVVYSHPHGDHFGGVRGLEADFADDVKIIAPEGFVAALADENMIAGNAMSRRTDYQYGTTLSQNARGQVDMAIGLNKGTKGGLTLITPTLEIIDKVEKHTIDGLTFEFTNVPGAEAPVEILTWIEEYKTLFTGELTYHGMHNIYTFRGAKVRDSLAWTKYLTEIKIAYGDRIEALTSSHSAPVWDTEAINEYITLQRDNYGFIHNQSMRLANNGVTINDVGREIEKIIPEVQFNTWHTNGYHGSYSHNARAVVNLYLGYHDMNPVNTNPLTTIDKSCTYVAAAGAETLYNAGMVHFKAGRYQESSQLFNDLVQCEPTNEQYRHALADSFEQQGYQSETMAWRNSYLQGAVELRTSEVKDGVDQMSADIIANSPTVKIFDMFAVRVNSVKAIDAGLNFTLTTVHPDTKEYFYTEVSSGNMTTVQTTKKLDADTTVFIHKSDFSNVLLRQTTFPALLETGMAGIVGQAENLAGLQGVMEQPERKFDILPLIKE